MSAQTTTPSARQIELLERAYRYALTHGLGDLSLRPLAAAIGSSPRVLLFLFGSKDGLVRALLARARAEELELLGRFRHPAGAGLAAAVEEVWNWLAAEEHRPLLTLWSEAYVRSLVESEGPWTGFAQATVEDWLALLEDQQPAHEKDSAEGVADRTLALAVLRGALLDLLATGDRERVDNAVRRHCSDKRRH
ncbi:TetR family transcriptional regulator [Mycobacterium sp. 21AC1]|uniref:TetR/AcrR family transcriptional regulator n=1 Tax=[Mycobacterium] appelbergii TaxID=2939269 RepID=UPI002938D582|nr:TetR/AcrR family transcriptional regulator [Mycobacterium sp. 21AC1]MDV3127194.1 TetR family transcriptional regulator [Mycobacterium sp. 21AC1]